MKLLLGDCLDKLKELEANSVDSIVTDPPYGLAFMGKKWDYDVPSQAIWEECMRVLKPGGHILSFAGSRTYHRMAVRIEDAGFEIRDQIMWIYGSGFPKSHNIGKNVEKRKVGGIKNLKQVGTKQGIKVETGTSGYSYSKEYVAGKSMGGKQISGEIPVYEITNEWEGWGTALKPAHEPIVMARKPLVGTVANNVLEYGVGGINIDGCRVGNESIKSPQHGKNVFNGDYPIEYEGDYKINEGRFPANIILDEEAGKILDQQSGKSKSSSNKWEGDNNAAIYGKYQKGVRQSTFSDEGGASRFFYCPKASKKDRDEGMDLSKDKQRPGQTDKGLYSSSPVCKDCGKTVNGTNDHSKCKEGLEYRPSTTTRKNIHPTVKPTDLMAYLIRLVTPKGGVVLDPFMGSGSTGKAAVIEGMEFIGIEREQEYYEIAKQRIENEINKRKFF
jgi:site-specific DNA-methyltransferase (adenine-specific)